MRLESWQKMSSKTIFKAEFSGLRTTKKGTVITLMLPLEFNSNEDIAKLMQYQGKPVDFALRIDMIEKAKQESAITEQQRKAIYKLIKDLGEHLGYEKDEAKGVLKEQYILESETSETFSLSDCHKEKAKDFIDWLLKFSMEEGMIIDSWIKSESEKVFEISVFTKKCIICGKDGDIHHIDKIGMGRDRKKVDDTNYEKVCLCREHHSECHNLGEKKFLQKYKLESD